MTNRDVSTGYLDRFCGDSIAGRQNQPMIKVTRIGVLVLLVMQLGIAAAQTDRIFVSNFDLELRVGEDSGSVRSQARVRSGHAFPVELGNMKIEFQITGISETSYIAELSVFEKTQSGWYLVTVDRPRIEGEFGIPIQFSTQSDEIGIDLAMSVAVDAVANQKRQY